MAEAAQKFSLLARPWLTQCLSASALTPTLLALLYGGSCGGIINCTAVVTAHGVVVLFVAVAAVARRPTGRLYEHAIGRRRSPGDLVTGLCILTGGVSEPLLAQRETSFEEFLTNTHCGGRTCLWPCAEEPTHH